MGQEEARRGTSWRRLAAAGAIIFLIYQAAEALQTVFRQGGPVGPALMILALAVAWPLGRWLGWRGFDAYGLNLRAGWFGLLVGGMLIAALAKLASLAAGLAAGGYILSTSSVQALTLFSIGSAMLVTFVPSIAEDILTRGLLLRAAPVELGFWSYTFGSAALYTANHIWRLDWGVSEQLRLFCLGLAYGAAAWRWRSLWGAVSLHWGWNLSNVLSDMAVPIENVNVLAGRYSSAMAHLVILTLILTLPSDRDPAHSDVSPDST